MKNIDSLGIEFGYELIEVIPYAYWLHSCKQLNSTISCTGTAPLYYFSPDHSDNLIRSDKYNNVANSIFPLNGIHHTNLDTSKWLPPPYKKQYKKNNIFNYHKPLLVICNKYNYEWNNPPINYIDLETLKVLFNTLKDDYTIVYNRPNNIIGDRLFGTFADKELCSVYPDIILLEDLYNRYKDNYNYLHLQMMLYANANYFISTQGGHGVFTSYFSEKNIIYAVRGQELKYDSYKWYSEFNGSEIYHVQNYTDLINTVKKHFI